MEEIPQPSPKVYQVKTTDNLLFSCCLTLFLCTAISAFPAAFLTSFFFPPKSYVPLGVSWAIISVVLTYFSLRRLYRDNHTQARIEVTGSQISLFDSTGKLQVSDDLRHIAQIYNSKLSIGNRGNYVDYFHVLFESGNLITFNQYLENNFTLEKTLKSLVGRDFKVILYSDYEMLNLETNASRAAKALRLKENGGPDVATGETARREH